MFETFSTVAREAIDRAQREARDMGHATVEVEHLLLELLGCGDEIVSGVWTDFELTSRPVGAIVQQRLGVDRHEFPREMRPFSRSAKDALRSAYRFGMVEPGPEHMLIVLTRRGEGAASDVIRALGTDPNQVRCAVKQRAFPRTDPDPSVQGRSSPRLEELDFGDL